MKVEMQQGEPSRMGGVAVALVEVSVDSFANREGKAETRRSATLTLDDAAITVEEGSRIAIGDRTWLVVRIRRRQGRGLVRLRDTDDAGRFASAIERFHDRGSPFDGPMAFLVEGVRTLHEVVGRIDEHPDTVGTFADPLAKAQKLLAFARRALSDAGTSAELLAYVDRQVTLCTALLDTVRSSTQETDVED